MTNVINIKDAPDDWQSNPDYVYIGRAGRGLPGTWGNPFRLNSEHDRPQIIQSYIRYITGKLPYLPFSQLRGKILVCWCAPKLCHGDVLALITEAEHSGWEKG